MSSGYKRHQDGLLPCGIASPRRCYRHAVYSRESAGIRVGLCQKHIEACGFICANCGMVDTDHLNKKCLFLPSQFKPSKVPKRRD